MTSSFAIVAAERAHLEPIAAISNAAIAEGWSSFRWEPEEIGAWVERWEATRESHPWLVALDGESVCGFAGAQPYRPRAAYRWTVEVSVYVRAGSRGARVGSRLYEALLPACRQRGFHSAVGVVALPNEASERLHAAFGFLRAGVLREIGWKGGAWRDTALWQIALRSGPPVE